MTTPEFRNVTGLVAAAGDGERLGGHPKALLEVGGRTLAERAVELLAPFCAQVVVAVRPQDVAAIRTRLAGRAECVAGGPTRQDTLGNLLRAARLELVVMHDVARPFATPALLTTVLRAAGEHGAAAPVVPLETRDSLALRAGDYLGEALSRDAVIGIQTPYACRRDLLEQAYAAADASGRMATSTMALLTRAGIPVRLVPGEAGNWKITYGADLETARRLLGGGS